MTRAVLWRTLMCALVAIFASTTPAFAQGTAASLSGVVTDTAGGVVPGASVIVKNVATGVSSETTTGVNGAFNVPALDPGVYSVTVSLTGFKTAVINDIRLLTATPASIQAKLEVGALTETVEVKGGSTLVQTTSSAVTSTIAIEQLKELPLVSRNALYSVAFLPGVETAGGPRGSTISGLPNNTVNITIDGITTGNAFMSTDGFFTLVTPRLDAVEEITVTGAVPGAGGGSGAVQIAFTTRSGTNTFNSSIYHSYRGPDLNSNYYFNKINGLEKNEVVVHQYGGRVGGPIIIPGLFNGRNKAFFFANFEHLHQPASATRTRTILSPDARQGNFSYIVGGQTREVNLLNLAAANGQTATFDPTITALLDSMRAAAGTTGTITTPSGATNTQNFVYQVQAASDQYSPTGRLDINLTNSHRLSGTYYWQRFLSKPDLLNNAEPPFPGFANQGFQTSYRTTGSVGLRSTLTSSMVNEVKGGWQWSPNNFFGNVTADMFENQGGYSIGMDFGNGSNLRLDDATAVNNPAPRNTVNWSIEDTLSWQKGAHSLSMGGSFQRIEHNQNSSNAVPTIGLGVDTNGFDPASAMFTTANFPGASSGNLTEARALYALLTGRVTSVGGTARLDADTGKYVYLGNLFQKSRLDSFDLYAQDSWRVTPTVTLNYGLRWDLQMPFTPVTNTWSTTTVADLCGASGIGSGPGGRQCNLFSPGEMPAGADFTPTYQQFTPGDGGYETDWNNFAPNVGFAWRPNVQDGWLKSLLGDPEQATIRAGYSVTYGFERMDRFTGVYGDNPGGTTVATRNYGTGFPLLQPGQTVGPVLFRNRDVLGPPTFTEAPVYPIEATAANSINLFDPNIKTPYVHQYSAGIQRSIGRDMAFEIRYVGNRNMNAWTEENWNSEETIFENGFLDEFRLAQQNLIANVNSGDAARAGSFAYFGPGTGTSPLPTYLAYFSRRGGSLANDPAQYNSANFRNSAWTGHLGQFEPDPRDAANDLHASTTFRANALAAGLPANFFVMNPAIGNGNITRSLAGTRYNALQIDLRRRLAQGLLVTANYTYAKRLGSSLQTLRQDRLYLTDTDVPHSYKMQWTYELPIGRGRRFGGNMNRWLDAVVGNWQWSGTGRVQKEMYDLGSVRVVGMSKDELQDNFKIRTVRANDGTITVFSFPQDIVDNTRRAYNSDPTSPTGYPAGESPTGRYIAPASTPDCLAIYRGDCGVPAQVMLLGPIETRFDMSIKKRFPFGRKANVEIGLDVLNVFDNINFNHNATPGGGAGTFRVDNAYTDINTTFDPGGRIGQLSWRITW
jgi:hypothetical protein